MDARRKLNGEKELYITTTHIYFSVICSLLFPEWNAWNALTLLAQNFLP